MAEIMFAYARKCKKCGKEIFPTAYWTYKEGGKYYCSWKCYNHRHDGKKKREIIKPNVGDTIKLVYISGIPQYSNKVGVVEFYDSMGQLHGTWGNWVVIPGEDVYEIIGESNDQ